MITGRTRRAKVCSFCSYLAKVTSAGRLKTNSCVSDNRRNDEVIEKRFSPVRRDSTGREFRMECRDQTLADSYALPPSLPHLHTFVLFLSNQDVLTGST